MQYKRCLLLSLVENLQVVILDPQGGISYSDGKIGSIGGWTTLRGSASTELANTLTPPPMPKEGGFLYPARFISYLLSAITVGIVCISLSAIPGSAVSVLIAFGSAFSGLDLKELGLTLDEFLPLGIIVGLGICASILGIIIGIVGFRYQRRYSKKQINEKERAYVLAKHAWDNAMIRWDRLYFCHRDGIIFDPVTNETGRPESLIKFIYSPLRKV